MKLRFVVLLALVVVSAPLYNAQAATSGAIFTTVVDASIVNANTQYTSKCQVYLDGGPGANAPAGAAGLPDGLYYFQVTDPSGGTLLSTDPVNNRQFKVAGGVITAYTGTGVPAPHLTGVDVPHSSAGAITVSMANANCPSDFADSPNNGGVYKAWVTPVASFVGDPTQVDNACGNGCYHGFTRSDSKTDNFKVQATQPTFCLQVSKILNGVPGLNWPITVTDPLGTVSNLFTNNVDGTLSDCGLTAGTYTVGEGLLPGSMLLGVTLNGSPTGSTTATFTWAATNPNPVVVFQNSSIE